MVIFAISILTYPSPSIEWNELAKVPTKTIWHFCHLKTEQRYILQAKVIISQSELCCFADSLCDFLKTLNEANKCLNIPLPKPKSGIGSTNSKDNICAHIYYRFIIDYPNRHICLSLRFEINNSCVFAMKKKDLHGHGHQIILTEFVNLNHREFCHFNKYRYYVAKKCEILESSYDV